MGVSLLKSKPTLHSTFHTGPPTEWEFADAGVLPQFAKIMKIQINTDNNIVGREDLVKQAKATVESRLGHLAEHVTRVEVHLSDENSDKGGRHDKRCLMEARLEGQQPIAVSDAAASLGQAIDGAVEKLKRLLDHKLGRLSDSLRRIV